MLAIIGFSFWSYNMLMKLNLNIWRNSCRPTDNRASTAYFGRDGINFGHK